MTSAFSRLRQYATHAQWTALAAISLALATGCSSTPPPGDINAIRADSAAPRAGNAYLIRGWIGIFSEGIDRLTDGLNKAGVRSHVYQETQQNEIAQAIIARYARNVDHEPLVFIGHSYGADAALNIATRLAESNVHVDLIITLDPVTPVLVPSNVRRTYNLYQSNGVADALPFLRGVPLKPAPNNPNQVLNFDLRADRTELAPDGVDHFNIEKLPLVHADVITRVKEVCPPRELWLSAQKAAGREPVPARTPTTRPR